MFPSRGLRLCDLSTICFGSPDIWLGHFEGPKAPKAKRALKMRSHVTIVLAGRSINQSILITDNPDRSFRSLSQCRILFP